MSVLPALSLALLCSCSPGPAPSGDRFPAGDPSSVVGSQQPAAVPKQGASHSVEILPKGATTGMKLILVASGFPLENGKIDWIVNGVPKSGQNPPVLDTALLRKGDDVQAKVILEGKEILSEVVILRNGPPEIRSVKFVPEVFRPGDSLGAEVTGADPDRDPVTIEYFWERNGKPAGTGSRLEGPLKRGDAITLTATPFDGESRGRSVTLRREIRNVPPSIEGARNAHLEGNIYTCRIQATDSDGDPLAFSLRDAPAGMSIDKASGIIRWDVPPEVRGNVPVTVAVTDGNGGEASYGMILTIGKEPEKERPEEKKPN